MSQSSKKNHIFLKHTADVKFQAFGKTPEKCFENAACALKEILTSQRIKTIKTKKISCKGKDFESLLYNFLEEFLFLLNSKNFIFSKIKKIDIEIQKKQYKITAEIQGDSSKNYQIKTDIKAITYNDMFVKFDDKTKKYACQVVVDV
ncbi:MAG TPA: archease [Candidatus Pacearchaeota archaeon]|nr:archease [Candidatus Pacearchaeota archaeon]